MLVVERKVAKLGQFWQKGKATALEFWRIMTENQFH